MYEDDFDTDINMDSLVVKPAIDSTQITTNCCFEFNLNKLHSEYTVILTKLINNQETIVAQSTVKVNIETPEIELKEISGKSVVLQFSNENTEGYELYRNDKLVANFNQNTYEDTDLQPETSYTYKVRSYKKIDNKKVYSDFSKEVEVKTLSQYGLPDVSGECKTYAYYTAVTATGSPQYKLLNGPNCYTDTKTGIRMVDNCYCELVEDKTPCEVGADVIVGSLIKNLGGAIAPNGAYVAGRHDLIELVAERLTLPGEGREVGPSLGINRSLYQGLFMAPSVVAASLKTAVLTAYIAEKMGYKVEPRYNALRADIVQSIIFENKDDLIKYCQGIQKYSPIDSFSTCYPAPMPGYDDEVIMASGSFTNGSSIELSCDGPIRSPFIAYQQGSISYQYGKIAVYNAFKELK